MTDLFKDLALAHADLAQAAFVKDSRATVTARDGGRGYTFDYMSLAAIVEVIRPILAAHNLIVVQMPSVEAPGVVSIRTIIYHADGGVLDCGTLLMAIADNRQQTIGTAISYGRRYALCAVLMLAAEDDDGNQGSGNQAQTTTQGVARQTQPPAQQQQPPPTEQRNSSPPARAAQRAAKTITLYRDVTDVDATLWLPKGMPEAIMTAARRSNTPATEKSHGFAAGVLGDCTPRYKDTDFMWDGDNESYSLRNMFELLTLGKTGNMTQGLASWVIETLHPVRNIRTPQGQPVLGDDGRPIREANPSYNALWANAVDNMMLQAIDYLSLPGMEDDMGDVLDNRP